MASTAVSEARARLGSVGVWLPPPTLAVTPAAVERPNVARIERLGYRSVWTGEHIGGKDVFAHLAVWLAATDRLIAGAGVANIWARHAATMQGAAATLADAFPGRLALALGVSSQVVVEMSGQRFERPLATLTRYLQQMDAAAAQPPRPEHQFPRLLAALGPRMLKLAWERADGTHPFLSPPEHTGLARAALGPDKLVVPHLPFVLEADPARARTRARTTFGPALEVPGSSYAANLRRLGFGDDDLGGGGSDRLIDALVAWGDESAVAARVRSHLDAGADHVLLHPLVNDLPAQVDLLERLAPAVTGDGGQLVA